MSESGINNYTFLNYLGFVLSYPLINIFFEATSLERLLTKNQEFLLPIGLQRDIS